MHIAQSNARASHQPREQVLKLAWRLRGKQDLEDLNAC
jgi:hypothetical protein